MNENGETIVVDVSMDALIDSLSKLRAQYADTEAAIKELKKAEGDHTAEIEKMTQQNKVLRQEIGGVEKQIQNEIKAQNANEKSLVQMRAQLANLNKQYDSMSGFDRMGVQGQQLQKTIADLSAEIQGLEENTGRWQRNVGNYRSALKGMKDATEAAGLSSQGLDRIMKGLSTNPWMAIVTLLVSILVKLRDRLKDNEQVTASLGKAMSSLQPVFDWFSKALSKIADIFSNVLDWAIEKTIDALGWFGRQLQKLGNLFGKDWGSGLIAYSDTMKKTAEVTTEAAETTETLTDSTTSLKNAVKDTRDALEDFLATYKKVVEEAKKESLADVLQKAGGTKTAADVIHDMQKAYDDLDLTFKKLDTTINDSDFGSNNEPSFIERLAADFQNNAQTIEAVSSSLQSSFGSLSSIYKQMSEDETKSEAEREAAAKKAKQWSALQIAANSGTAIAKGVAASMDKPFPANLAALASTLAAVIAAIAQAKALAKGFETGGVIGGFQGATMGRDNTVASVRTGEMVLNANQQKTLFEIANGGATTSLTASLVAALQAMPAPVVEYTELQRFGNKVNILENNAKLK